MSKKPPTSEGSTYELTGPKGAGPFLLPHISEIGAATLDKQSGVAILEATSADGKSLLLPILVQAASSLVRAQESISDLWDGEIAVITEDISNWPDPVELPLLVDFVAFVNIDADRYLLAFLSEEERRVAISISHDAYLTLVNYCKNLPAIR